ncbi:MAG: hypothetical protein RBT71_01460 [Flavobacteriales bacterium]|jgi:hypothetical protein|nr:hypothetical protein [Flavobacteriales bacterium]
MKHLLLGSAVLLLAACGDGKKEAAEKLAAMEQESATAPAENEYLLDLSPFDMPLSVSMPEMTVPDADSTFGGARWNEDTGQLIVQAGARFAITISEEPGDIGRLKAALERDMLRKHTILEEAPDLVVYRQEYPDDALVFVHFYQVIAHEGRQFVVESAPQGRFTEADVHRMRSAVRANLPA